MNDHPALARTALPAGPAIWSRSFRLYFTARTSGLLGDAMLPVAVSAGLIGSGHSVSTVGYALAWWLGPFAGLILFGGVLADRFTARRMMVGADLANLTTRILLAVLFFQGIDHLWQLYALLAVAGAAGAMFQPGAASTVPLVARDVQGANGVLRTSEAVTALAGPALAGALVGAGSTGWVMVIAAGTFGLSSVCLIGLRLGPVPAPPPGDSLWRNLATGWREFRARRWMWGVILIWMVYSVFAAGPVIPLAAGVLVPAHGSAVFGLLSAVYGVGTVVGGLVAIRFKPRHPLAAGSLAMLAAPLYPLGIALDLPVPALVGCLLVAGAGYTFWGVMWATSVQTQVPGEVLNRIHAYEVAGSVCMVPLGSALAGPAAGAYGARAVLLFGAVVGVGVVAALLLTPAIRGLRRAPERGAAGDGGAAGPILTEDGSQATRARAERSGDSLV